MITSAPEECRDGRRTIADHPDELVQRYSARLARFAQRQIGPLLSRRTTVEDTLQTVFRTFFRRSQAGEFKIDHAGALWNLLAKLTLNKVRKQAEWHRAQRRDVARETLVDPQQCDVYPLRQPRTDDILALADEVEWLLSDLSPRDVEIVQGLLAEQPVEALARSVGCSRATVRRVRERVALKLQNRIRQHSAD